MAVRAMNSCVIFRSAATPPLAVSRRCCCLRLLTASSRHRNRSISHSFLRCAPYPLSHVTVRSYSVQNLVEMVMEELASIHKRGRVRATSKYLLLIL
uniref:EMB2730 n=1 Tax=Solanum tuberosum TaxID=4113 RepID=M1AH73_SOLTU